MTATRSTRQTDHHVIQVVELTKQYRGRPIVNQLSFAVERGDVFGFLGQNGAGKSTTIRMLLGLVRPTSGFARLLGIDMSRHPTRALGRVGAIIEAPAFYDTFSGWQNLQMLAALSGGVTRSRIAAILELVGLKDRAQDPVRIYSHGMRQRLGIAQALLPRPECIILDEPADGLDPQGIHEIRMLISRLRDEEGVTILLSSHLLYEVEQICNRIAIIDTGCLLYQGAVNELVTKVKTIRVRVEPTKDAFELLSRRPTFEVSLNGDECLYVRLAEEEIPELNALLVGRGMRVSEITPQRETLEQAFLRLTAKPPLVSSVDPK
jgi:ABC-2 type transport system ATP-binding protein